MLGNARAHVDTSQRAQQQNTMHRQTRASASGVCSPNSNAMQLDLRLMRHIGPYRVRATDASELYLLRTITPLLNIRSPSCLGYGPNMCAACVCAGHVAADTHHTLEIHVAAGVIGGQLHN